MAKSKNAKKQVQVEEVIEVATETKPTKIELTETQQEVLTGLTSTSAKIRWLASEGYKNGPISSLLGIRYQHVRNVLTTPLKRAAQ